MASVKIDAATFEIDKVEPATTTKVRYTLEFLTEQKATILAQKASEIAQRDKEIAEVDALLAEAKKLGIK
jgi:ABC-type uncharacterized transport system auxiliary subunit